MAIALDAVSALNNTNWTAGSSHTWSHTCAGSDRYLVVGFFTYGAGDTVTGVTYNGVSMTRIQLMFGNPSMVCLYGLIAPSTGANNIVVSLSGSNNYCAGGGVSYTGCNQTSQPNASGTNNPTGTALTQQLTTTVDGCWLGGIFRREDSNAVTRTGGTYRYGYTPAGGISYDDTNGSVGVAGTYSIAQSGASAEWTGAVVAIAPAASSSSVNSGFFGLM